MTAATDRASTRHAGLDRDEIVDRALALVEEGGAESLTMRKLAADLGVTTTTIYWHVGSRDELVVALIQRLAARQAMVPITGSSAQERVESAARNIWATALAHRNVTLLASQAGATTLLELPLETALVAELEAAGVHGTDARDALRAVLACIAGFLVLAWRSDERIPEALRASSLWAEVHDARLGHDTLAALATPVDLDALFERTLAVVVESFLADEAQQSSTRPGRSTTRGMQ